MYGLTLAQIAAIIRGRLEGGREDAQPQAAGIDSRQTKAGDLFFAVKGEKTDGHLYLEQAGKNGAVGAVVKYRPDDYTAHGLPLIFVEDPQKALQELAVAVRRRFAGPVAAITGSTGKTTTKDMLSSVLAQKGEVLKTSGNYNNALGLPLTILSLKPGQWSMVLEMGMSALGEIDFLTAIGQPEYGIITNVGHSHQELLGSQEKIAQAKAELLSHLPVGGGVVLNIADRKLLKPWLSNIRCRVDWVGEGPKADYRAVDIVAGRSQEFTICSRREEAIRVKLPLPGRHNIQNALATAALARQLGIGWEQITAGLAEISLTPMRMQIQKIKERDILILNDTYNANPASMQAALDVLHTMARGKRALAVLGDMYELGDYSKEGHCLVGKKAKETGVAYLITVGELGSQIAEGALAAGMKTEKIRACQNKQEALCYIKEILSPGDVVLVKGSRGIRMEEIVCGILSLP